MKKKLTSLLLIATLTMPALVHGKDSTETRTRTFQFGFVTPIGTNGTDSWNVTNKFSINLLAGYAAGVDGVEFSGLTSILKSEMNGAQFSGLGNLVLGKSRGAQFSGLFNIVLKNMQGAQAAGFINFTRGAARGIQIAGFANYAKGGIVAQVAGFSNISTGITKGFQLAGFTNIISQQLKGVQMAGFFNYGKGEKFSQIGGFGNVVVKDLRGFQLAGFTNITTGMIKGVQISGFFNYARKLNGVQIAPFNFIDSLEKGVPIGVLSIVRNGYRAFEFSATETLYGVFSFKTGVRKFYNILSVGGGYRDKLSLFAWGYGLGTLVPISKKVDLAIEGLCYQVNEGEWFTNRVNLLNKLNFTASWKIAKHTAIFGGLSWNITVSDVTDEYGDKIEAHIAPWSVFDELYNERINVKMYPGMTIGVRL